MLRAFKKNYIYILGDGEVILAISQDIPYMAKLSRGKTFTVVHKNTLFTGKLSQCIRPRPLCTVHGK